MSDEANRSRTQFEKFSEQLTFTNARMLAIIDDLLAVPAAERPVIIVQADEGPYPKHLEDQTRHDWTTATLEEREIKFGIMNAWYLPDGRDIGLYPEISPVNTFRLLFNGYFDTDLSLLPDESYTLSHPEPLEFPEFPSLSRCAYAGAREMTSWVLLELDALVGGLADQAVAGPAGELGADDELRAQPLGVAGGRAGRRRRERRRIGRERRDGGQELGPVGVS